MRAHPQHAGWVHVARFPRDVLEGQRQQGVTRQHCDVLSVFLRQAEQRDEDSLLKILTDRRYAEGQIGAMLFMRLGLRNQALTLSEVLHNLAGQWWPI